MSASVYGEDATVVFSLDEATTQDDFLLVAEELPYLGDSEANLDRALRMIKDEVFSLDGFARQKVPKMFVILTASDCSTCTESLETAVEDLKKEGVHIITIPIGNKPKLTDMDTISSLPSKEFVFPQTSFTDLLNGYFIQKISSIVCSGKTGACVEPPLPENCDNIIYNCNVDIDCPDTRKCCFKNCEKTCENPVTGIEKFENMKFVRRFNFAL